MPTASILVNALATPREVPVNTVVTLSEAAGGWLSYNWTLLDQPEGAADALVGPTTATPTITPKKEGTYLILLVVNAGTNTEQRVMAVFYVLRLLDGRRNPAAGETLEQNMVRGWAENVNQQLTDISDLRKDAGRQAGVINFNGSAANSSVLYVAGTQQLLATLPGSFYLPTMGKALANSAATLHGDLYLLDRGVINPTAPVAGEVIWARIHGVAYNVPIGGTTFGDPIYLSNAGLLDIAPGATSRQVGIVVEARLGDCDVEFDGHRQGF